MEDELFDNGIDGEPFDGPGDDYYEEEDYREHFDVCNANGLEITGWPTYGNYVILTNKFHVYCWPGSDTLEIFELKSGSRCANIGDPHVLTLKGQDLYFFGDKIAQREDGSWEIAWYTGEQVNAKIQRYLNLKAFI